MFAVVQAHDGYANVNASTGPHIDNAADWLSEANLPVPEPKDNEVLIRMRTASVNPSDVHFIKGEYGQPRVKGMPAGFEGCGDVVSAGKGAEAFLGQRVAFIATVSGAWAEYAVTKAEMCIPLRAEIGDDDGAAQIVNPLTAMAMVDIAREAGDSFVVSAAASQLGKLMCALGRDLGLKPVALVRRGEKIRTLEEIGAEKALAANDPDLLKKFAKISAELKPRVFLDAVADQLSENLFCAMPNGARWVCYGKLDPDAPRLTQVGQLIFMSKRIEGFLLPKWMMKTPPDEQMRVISEVQARFSDGRWKTDVSTRLKLKDVVSNLAEAMGRLDGKVIITA